MPSQSKSKVSTAKSWKGKKSLTSELTLPSGNVCKVKRVSIAKLLAADLFPDQLTAQITETINAVEGKKKAEPLDVSKVSMADMAKLMLAADKVTAFVVIDPVVRLHVDADDNDIDPEDRDDEVLYTDDVDEEDKMFIFQWAVGGGSDLDSFRAETSAALGGVEAGVDVAGSAV